MLPNYPFTGLGMWAAARFGVWQNWFTQTATLHIDWVEIIVGTGAWGLTSILLLLMMSWYVLVRTTINSHVDMEYRQIALEGVAVLAVVFVLMLFMTDLSRHPPCHFLAALGAAEFLRQRLKHGEGWRKEYVLNELAPNPSVS